MGITLSCGEYGLWFAVMASDLHVSVSGGGCWHQLWNRFLDGDDGQAELQKEETFMVW